MSTPTPGWQSTPLDERPFVRQIGDRRVWMLLFMRASALQGTHPVIAQGIADHSHVWTDPTGRLPETIRYGLEMYLGHAQPETASEIREMHRGISGELDDGSRYHAWNRDVWAWVHLTAVEALIFALDTCFGPLAEREVERLYQQSREGGRLYGVPEALMPDSVADLRAFIAERLPHLEESTATSRIREFTDEQMAVLLPGPPAISSLLSRPLRPWLRSLVYGTYPEVIRARWDIEWSRKDQRRYRWLVKVIRALNVLPERLRLLPQARAMLNA